MISIIIPVYNCEKYLQNGIESLIKQTIFNELEFVFVDDGSTDNSRNIIRKYVDIYENMTLIVQSNAGVSEARNRGIKESKGEYIAFFDADDIALPSLYEKLYDLLKNNSSDISIVDYSMVFENGEEKKHRQEIIREWENKDEALESFFSESIICTNPVDKMFTRKIVEKISFPEGYAIGEDMFFVYKAICEAHKIVIDTTQALYKYCLHPDSAMKKKFEDKHFDAVRLAKKILDEFEKNSKLYDYAEANYVHEICKMLGLLYRENVEQEYVEKVSKYKKYIKQYSIFKALKYMDKKHVIALELMKVSPILYIKIYKAMKVG